MILPAHIHTKKKKKKEKSGTLSSYVLAKDFSSLELKDKKQIKNKEEGRKI